MTNRSIVPENRWGNLMNAGALDALADDQILTEVDTGGARNGTLVLSVNLAASSDLSDVTVWTSAVSDFLTDGTAASAVASDGTAKVTLSSDTSNLYAKGVTDGSISDLNVSDNKIKCISQDGMYVIGLKNLSRYVNVQYDDGGAGNYMSAVFIGHDSPELPWGGEQAAY